MKRAVLFTLTFALAMVAFVTAMSLNSPAPAAAAPSAIWSDVAELQIPAVGTRQIVPVSYRTVALDLNALQAQLANAPFELTDAASSTPLIVELPRPDGSLAQFRIEEYSMMEPGLAAQYPEWRTYHGQGVDDPTAVARLDVTVHGFHGMVLGGTVGTYYIDPFQQGDTTNYISYYKNAYRNTRGEIAADVVEELEEGVAPAIEANADLVPTDGILRTYRLANAATGEYTAFHGGTVATGQAAIVTAINRVNGVYEREVAARLLLVANNSLVVYTDAATDPYTNNSGTAMLGQNQTNLNAVIGNANYDIGHVFSTGGGGVASLRSVCSTANKARGVTGLPAPTGDPFYIDYVAHEMGHQFGGNHTFNATTSSCGGGNRFAGAAYEPGSGITIMAYAGICGAEDIAEHSIDTFSTHSFQEIRAHMTNTNPNGGGDSCDAPIDTDNDAPVVNAGADFTIPANTPFDMTGSATDSNATQLTYDWQQYNAGTATTATTTHDDLGSNPLFRPYSPETDGTRNFPNLNYILSGDNEVPATVPCPFIPGQPTPTGNCSSGERLPYTARTMSFRLTVRDNVANGGGVDFDTAQVTVVPAAGPFVVTSNNSANVGGFPGNSTQTVTWNVANTTAAPISCATVNVLVSADGGDTFPYTAASALPNNGSGTVTLPNVTTSEARYKVQCANNIFYDINDADFAISEVPTAVTIGGLTTQGNGMLPLTFAVAGLAVVGLVALLRRR